MTANELERRVNRLENDVTSIYDMLTTITQTQAEHSVQLTGLRSRLDEHTVHLAYLREQVGAHDQRFDKVDQRFDKVESTLEEILGLLRAG